MKIFRKKEETGLTGSMPVTASRSVPGAASQALVELASENWRFQQTMMRALDQMDPFDANRVESQYLWYQKKVLAVLEEAGLRTVDLTGQRYDVGMAVTPLNLEDFPDRPEAHFRIAQMVEPIVMEGGEIRRAGTVMLGEEQEET